MAEARGGPPPALREAVARVLRPLVRLMLSFGITYPMLAELLKSLFVETAERHFRIGDKPPTDSRINLLTGVHRKDVRRLRGRAGPAREIAPKSVSLGAQLVAAWTSKTEFTSAGHPRPLARFASEGGTASFEALVESVSKDIRARAVLDEWLRLGVAHIDDANRVCLNVEAFVPAKGLEEMAFYFGHNVHDHIAASAHNLGGARPPFLERSVHYDELSEASAAELARLSESLATEALKSVNREAMRREERDRPLDKPNHRITFGVYFYTEPSGGHQEEVLK